jgi:hypothetical protein
LIPAVTPVMLVVLALLGDCFSKASVPWFIMIPYQPMSFSFNPMRIKDIKMFRVDTHQVN